MYSVAGTLIACPYTLHANAPRWGDWARYEYISDRHPRPDIWPRRLAGEKQLFDIASATPGPACVSRSWLQICVMIPQHVRTAHVESLAIGLGMTAALSRKIFLDLPALRRHRG